MIIATTLNFTDRLPSFVCEHKYTKCEMVVGIEFPNNNTVKNSEPILTAPRMLLVFYVAVIWKIHKCI